MTVTIRVQNFGRRLIYAECNHKLVHRCTVPHDYVTARLPPNYPVPSLIGAVQITKHAVYFGYPKGWDSEVIARK